MKDNIVPDNDKTDGTLSSGLLERARQGDEAAFQTVVKLYLGLVFHWCLTANLKREDAEDVAQQVFISVSSNLKNFRREQPGSSFRGWLRIITKSKIADFYRMMARREEVVGGDVEWAEIANSSLSDFDSAVDLEKEQALVYRRAMELIQGEFSDSDSKAFMMLVVDNLSAREVAERLSVSVNSVYIAKSRILKRLKSELSDIW